MSAGRTPFFDLFLFYYRRLATELRPTKNGVEYATYVQHVNEEVGLLALTAKLLPSQLHVLLQLTHGVFQGRAGVVNLVDDEDVLADQVGHLERAQVEPLCTGDLGSRDLLGIITAEVFVEGQADSLDGDVGLTGALEEGSDREKVYQRYAPNANTTSRQHTGECEQGRNHRRQ